MGCVPQGLVELWWFTSASHEYIGHSIPIRAISKLWQGRAAAAVESARRELRERQIVKKKIWTDCKTCFGQIVKLFFLTNYKTFSSPQGVVQWSPTRPFGILEKKMYSTKVPPEFDRAQISTYFYSLSISNESDAILTKPKHAELQLHNFQQSIKGQPKLKVLLSKAMQEKANLKFIQGTGYTLYLSILVHHRTI